MREGPTLQAARLRAVVQSTQLGIAQARKDLEDPARVFLAANRLETLEQALTATLAQCEPERPSWRGGIF